jgi:hypothetical protein
MTGWREGVATGCVGAQLSVHASGTARVIGTTLCGCIGDSSQPTSTQRRPELGFGQWPDNRP